MEMGIGKMSVKSFRLGNRSVEIEGISEEDPYFAGMRDGSEDVFFNFCRQNLPSDGIALDIGANIGLTAACLSQCLPDGKILAFEPARTVYPILRRNIERNQFRNVTTFDSALGEAVGTARFSDNSAFGHFDKAGHEVSVSTIDAVTRDLPRLDFIKIDVEGFEPSVLRGATETIRRFAPIIYMEFNSWCLLTYSRTNPLTFLEELCDGFTSVSIVSAQEPTLVRKLERSGAFHFLHSNMTNGFVDDLVLKRAA